MHPGSIPGEASNLPPVSQTMADRSSPAPGPQPRHGGGLVDAARLHGIPLEDWLDLSTGINPHAFPLPPFAPDDLHRLPDPAALRDLIAVARRASAAPADAAVLAVPGSDLALRLIPLLFPRGSIAVLSPTYSGHAEAWDAAGHAVRRVADISQALDAASIIVLANPNNPDGRTFTPERLAAIGQQHTLIVDEAFCDLAPEASVVPMIGPRTIVLRSFGKFFGLAGLRLGFVIGDRGLLAPLERLLGDWPVSGPAIAAGRLALADTAWQAATRTRLAAERARLDSLLRSVGYAIIEGTDLFRSVITPDAAALHLDLARRGIWTRIFAEDPTRIRIGIPPEGGFERLERAVSARA